MADRPTSETAETAEQAFATFRRNRDPRALAAAFDATAGELLRVAAFLVPRDDVEDLLHETYGVAVARAAAYDPGRPLLPWLFGILANEARTLRRRARMRSRERDARPPHAARDPAAAAADREAEAAFAAALQQLGHAEAELLRLHLVDELSCREIAERRRQPAGTVRTQVARAMAELRRRLPVGLAAAPGLGIADVQVLAALRQRVLDSAPGLATAAALTTTGRSTARWAFAALATAAIVAIGAFALRDDPPPYPPAARLPNGPVTAAPARGAAAATPAAPSTPADDDARTAAALPPPRWLLRGFVRDEHGAPIAGAEVRCHREEMGPIVATTTTAADGGYELDLAFWRDRPALDRSGYELVAFVTAAGRNTDTWFGELPGGDAEAAVELTHDFELVPYRTLAGRAVDRAGSPVPARVNVSGATDDQPLFAIATADAGGRFRLVLTGEAQRLRVDLRHPGAGRRRLEVDAPASGERELGDVVLDPGLPLAGSVALTDGTPLPQCRVFVRGGLKSNGGLPQVGPDYWYFEAETDERGAFVANRMLPGEWAVRVNGTLGLTDDVVRDERWLPEGTDRVDIVLDAVRVDLVWRDSDGRKLLPQASRIVVFGADAADAAAAARAGDAAALQRAVADSTTRSRHLVVPCGAWLWLQSSSGGRFAADELLRMPAHNGRVTAELRLAPVAATQLTVRVRFADGAEPEQFSCRVEPQPGASPRAFEVLRREPGSVTGRCGVGPVRILVAAYPDMFDEVFEHRDVTAVADRTNEVEVVLARRGPIRFVLHDAGAPDPSRDDGLSGEVTIGAVTAQRFFWRGDGMEYWGDPPLGRPVASMALVPVGRHEVRFAFDGYQPTTVTFDVTEGEGAPIDVWLQPR